MLSRRKGSLSATTQVKVSSSENIHIALGQGFHFPETNTDALVNGESVIGVPESESVAGKRIDHIGTWENQTVPNGSRQRAGEAMRRYGGLVVGLAHSRGVNRAMPVEPQEIVTLEGASSSMTGDEVCDAIP